MTEFQEYLHGNRMTRFEYVSAIVLQGLLARDGARGANTPKEYLAEEAVKMSIALLTETHNETNSGKYTND